jgi:hypothetical protein
MSQPYDDPGDDEVMSELREVMNALFERSDHVALPADLEDPRESAAEGDGS